MKYSFFAHCVSCLPSPVTADTFLKESVDLVYYFGELSNHFARGVPSAYPPLEQTPIVFTTLWSFGQVYQGPRYES